MGYRRCLDIYNAVIIEYKFNAPSELATRAASVQQCDVPAVFQHTCNHDSDYFRDDVDLTPGANEGCTDILRYTY